MRILAFFFVGAGWCACARGPEDPALLARVGQTRIETGDLAAVVREAESAAPRALGPAWYAARLQGLVDREILLSEARDLGLDEDATVRRRLAELETAKLASAMVKQEVVGPSAVSAEEMRAAFEAGGWDQQVEAQEIFVVDPDTAEVVSEALRQGEDFDLMAQKYCVDRLFHAPTGAAERHTYSPPDSPAQVVATLFTLPVGGVSRPIPFRDGYVIARVAERRQVDQAAVEDDIRKVLLEVKRQALREDYLRRLRTELDLQADAGGMDLVLQVLRGGEDDSLSAAQLQGPCYTYGDSVLTVGEALEELRPRVRTWPEVSEERLRQEMRDRVLPARVMALDARRRGVEASAAWQAWREWQLEDLMLARARRRILDARVVVTEADIEEDYERDRQRFRIPGSARIQELLVDDAELARRLAQQCRQGADLEELIARYGSQTAPKGGEVQVYASQGPLYGEEWVSLAMNAPLHEIQGPIATRDAYSIFAVQERRDETFAPLTNPKVHRAVERAVRERLEREVFNTYMAELRRRYESKIEIYDDNLERWVAARKAADGQ